VAVVTTRQLLEAGMHFGHQTRRWNPKMRRFILGERNGIYIIDLHETLKGVESAYNYVRDLVADGGVLLFVGTKKQTQGPIATYARACGMPYVNERWLGGMLTNFATISSRVGKLREYEAMERSGDFDAMPKKEGLRHRRELEKLRRNLGGIRDLDRLPDSIFVIDTKKEHIAVTEANKLTLPIVAVVDTNCDPDEVTHVIPGNDDAIRSGSLMCRVMAEAVVEGRWVAEHRKAAAPAPTTPGNGVGGARGSAPRSRRSQMPVAPADPALDDPDAASVPGVASARSVERPVVETVASPAPSAAPIAEPPSSVSNETAIATSTATSTPTEAPAASETPAASASEIPTETPTATSPEEA